MKNIKELKKVLLGIVGIIVVCMSFWWILIMLIIDGYTLCTLPFEIECDTPSGVYSSDPVTDREILNLVYGNGYVEGEINVGIVGKRNRLYDEDTVDKGAVQKFVNVPILDANSTYEKNKTTINSTTTETKPEENKTTNGSERTTIYENSTASDSSSQDEYTINQVGSGNPQLIEAKLNRYPANENKLYGTYSIWESAAAENGIDITFVTAISLHETGWGRSSLLWNYNNPGGIRCVSKAELVQKYNIVGCVDTDHGDFTKFATVADGIRYKVNLLKRSYIDKGLLTVAQVGSVYAPINDPNDKDGANKNWIPNVSKLLYQMGVTKHISNVGIPGVIDIFEFAKVPDWNRYDSMLIGYKNLTAQEKAELMIFDKSKVLTEREMEEAAKSVGISINQPRNEILKKLEAKGPIHISYKENEDDWFTIDQTFTVTTKKAYISEAELALRSILQMDLNGQIDMDTKAYDEAASITRIQRQIENSKKTAKDLGGLGINDDYSNVYLHNESTYDVDKLEMEFIKWLAHNDYLLLNISNNKKKASDLTPKDLEYAEKVIQEVLSEAYTYRHVILHDSFIDGAIYGHLYVNIEEDIKKNDKDKFLTPKSLKSISSETVKQVLDEKLQKLKNDKKVSDATLSSLMIGDYLKRQALQVFTDNYGWFSLSKDNMTSEFKKYVDLQREKVVDPDKYKKITNSGSVWDNLLSDFMGSASFVFNSDVAFKRLVLYNYFDFAMSNNQFVRYVMYSNSSDIATIGAYARDMCFFNKEFGRDLSSSLCIRINDSAIIPLEWNETEVIDKSRANMSIEFVCVPVDSEITQTVPGGDSKLDDDLVQGAFADAWDRTTNFFSSDKKLRPFDPYKKNSQIMKWESFEKSGKDPQLRIIGMPLAFADIHNQGYGDYEDGREELANQFYGVMDNFYSDVLSGGQKSQVNKIVEEQGVSREVATGMVLVQSEGTLRIGIYDGEDKQTLIGELSFSSEKDVKNGDFHANWISLMYNMEKELIINAPQNCDSETERPDYHYDLEHKPYYESVYTAYAKLQKFNHYTTKMINPPEDVFRVETGQNYMSLTNVDTVSDALFREDFQNYLTKRIISNDDSSGSSGSPVSGNHTLDPSYLEGMELQSPIPWAPSQPVLITDGFGMRTLNGKTALHRGLDLKGFGNKATPVLAAADGVVLEYKNQGSQSWGTWVSIKHTTPSGKTFVTLYGHMVEGSVKFKVGDVIKRGDAIGYMGRTGAVTGVHLHFDLYKGFRNGDATAIDSMPLIYNKSNATCSAAADNCVLR